MPRTDLTDLLGSPAEITWDPEGQAIYLKLADPAGEPVSTDVLDYGINVDFAGRGRMIGVEILLSDEEWSR